MSDTLTDQLSAAVADRIDLDKLGRIIADHLRTTPAAAAEPYNPNDPYPATEIRKELGRRGRPMSHVTFIKNYIDSGLLRLVEGPKRSSFYVRRGDWEKLKNETHPAIMDKKPLGL